MTCRQPGAGWHTPRESYSLTGLATSHPDPAGLATSHPDLAGLATSHPDLASLATSRSNFGWPGHLVPQLNVSLCSILLPREQVTSHLSHEVSHSGCSIPRPVREPPQESSMAQLGAQCTWEVCLVTE